MTKPKDLERFQRERCLGDQALADAIYDATKVRLAVRTLTRFMQRHSRPASKTQLAIDKFMASQRAGQALR